MRNILKQFRDDESGATAIEYGLIAALIALAIVAGAGAIGTALDEQFQDIAARLNPTGGGSDE